MKGKRPTLRNYSQPGRAERLISAGRIILAAFALFAIWLDPTAPAKYAIAAYYLLAGYLCYSILLAFVAWRMDLSWPYSTSVIHAIDLLIFAVFMYLTSGPSSPFFAFFVFCLVSATFRWQWRGTIYTAVIALAIEIILVAYPDLPHRPAFEVNHFIFRIGYLLVVATLLGYLGAYEHQERIKIAALAAWPRTTPEDVYAVVSEILQRSSSLLAAPRTLILWREEEEPQLHVGLWADGKFHHSTELPQRFESWVAESLAGKNFFCGDTLARKPWVLCSSPTGFERWQGMPLHPDLQRHFSIKSVLSLDLQSECVMGRIFALDRKNAISDDLVLGKIVCHEASCSLDLFYHQKQLQQSATAEERIRLARDLHDGLLQSLTAAGLQIEFVHKLMEKEPQKAEKRLLDIQKLIYSESQNLRSHIKQLKPPYSSFPEWDGDLPQRLKDLAERIEGQWGLSTSIDVNLHLSRLPWTMAQGVYFIIREAMINAARHSEASSIKAEMISTDHRLHIVVEDDGQGFPFTGRYDHAALTEANIGPIILRERVASLGGQLAIESGKTGARLEIKLPIQENMS